MLTFTTSSTKKRKLSPQHTKGESPDSNPDFPLNSVEDRGSQSPDDSHPVPPSILTNGSALPPNIPQHLQGSISHSFHDYVSSAASSPSAAYAGLSIEGERGGEGSGSQRQSSLVPYEQDPRGQSPLNLFTHRAIMGGAEDLPNRASSPLKRRASDLDLEDASSQKDDVDMITVPSSDPQTTTDTSTRSPRVIRAHSVNMLDNEEDPDTGDVTSTPLTGRTKNVETGKGCLLSSTMYTDSLYHRYPAY